MGSFPEAVEFPAWEGFSPFGDFSPDVGLSVLGVGELLLASMPGPP